MDHYFELRILPDPEFAFSLLMNALYSKLHRALVQLKSTDIGVSFPHYDQEKKRLGERVRLHSRHERLQELMSSGWLKGMQDHIRLGGINQVPGNVQYAIFCRVQAKSNAERIRRRQMKRHSLSYEKALELIPDSIAKPLQLPFVNLNSQSTEQRFSLFIKQEIVAKPIQGIFNTYGLSKEATVPLF